MTPLATGAAVLVVALVAGGGLGALILLRRKFRRVWQRLWELEGELNRQRAGLVEFRKAQCLAQISDLRLPSAMPSQHGEELVLLRFFEGRRSGFFVEIGAYDGVTFSNTYLLEALGWDGILVEANPERLADCLRARPHSRCVQAAVVAKTGQGTIRLTVPVGEGGVDTLAFTQAGERHLQRVARATSKTREVETPAVTIDEILDGHQGPIDFVSVDIEGAELAALQGMDIERWLPDLFVIEDNSMGQDRGVSDYLGRFGYVERLRLAANVFYAKAGEKRPILAPLS